MLAVSADGRAFSVAAGEKTVLNFTVWQAPGVQYTLKSDDVITLFVRRKADIRSELVIEKSGDAGSNSVTLEQEDTEWLLPGNYSAVACIDIPAEDIYRKPIWPYVQFEEVVKDGYGLPANNFILRTGVVSYG